MDTNSRTLNSIIKKGKSYKNLIFKSEIKDNRIWVYNLNYQLVKVLNSGSKVSESFNIPTTTLFRYIESGKLWKKKNLYFYNNKTKPSCMVKNYTGNYYKNRQ